jgi:hypothetical protein
MADPKRITIEPDSDTAKLLKLARNDPVIVECGDVLYRIERDPADPFFSYDPDMVRAAFHQGVGMYEGAELEQFIKDTLEQRG